MQTRQFYQLMIWQQDKLIYYNDFTNKSQNYQQLSNSHRIQNCQGLSLTIGAFIKQIHPNRETQFKNFRTKEYQFNLYETVNGVKFILITSLRNNDDEVHSLIQKIYKAYVEYVKRNYMYQHGDVIRMPIFDEAVIQILGLKKKDQKDS